MTDPFVIGQLTPEPDYPWLDHEGKPFVSGDAANVITRPSDFIRLCCFCAEKKTYAVIVYAVDDWPRNEVLIDAYSASGVRTVYQAVSFRNKKKLVRMVREGGPLYLTEQCFKALNAVRK